MVLRLSPGETAEKSILIRNINNISVEINLSVTGDLADSVVLNDKYFVLSPGQEKQAYFTIKSANPGMTETRINVMFNQPEGGGVVLTSVITVISGNITDETEANLSVNTNSADNNSTLMNKTSKSTQEDSSSLWVLIATPLILVIILFFLFVYSRKIGIKKEAIKSKKSASENE